MNYKKIKIIVLICISFIITACGGGGTSGTSSDEKVKIKGSLPTTTTSKSLKSKDGKALSDIGDITMILGSDFFGNKTQGEVNTQTNEFNLEVTKDENNFVGMYDNDYNLLGYVAKNETDILPLFNNEKEEIELGSLTADTTNTASVNKLEYSADTETTFDITTQQKELMSYDDKKFLLNTTLDADKNGIIDAKEDKVYRLSPVKKIEYHLNDTFTINGFFDTDDNINGVLSKSFEHIFNSQSDRSWYGLYNSVDTPDKYYIHFDGLKLFMFTDSIFDKKYNYEGSYDTVFTSSNTSQTYKSSSASYWKDYEWSFNSNTNVYEETDNYSYRYNGYLIISDNKIDGGSDGYSGTLDIDWLASSQNEELFSLSFKNLPEFDLTKSDILIPILSDKIEDNKRIISYEFKRYNQTTKKLESISDEEFELYDIKNFYITYRTKDDSNITYESYFASNIEFHKEFSKQEFSEDGTRYVLTLNVNYIDKYVKVKSRVGNLSKVGYYDEKFDDWSFPPDSNELDNVNSLNINYVDYTGTIYEISIQK